MGFRMSYLLAVVFSLLLFSCRERDEAKAPAPPLPESPSEKAYLQEWYCFNGNTIVQGPNGYGLIDTTGREILSPVYDEVVFLSDDIVLIQQLGMWMLSDGNGWIFAESRDRNLLVQGSEASYEQMLVDERNYWERVTAVFDSLSRACLLVRSGKVSSSDLLELESREKDLEDLLEEEEGRTALK